MVIPQIENYSKILFYSPHITWEDFYETHSSVIESLRISLRLSDEEFSLWTKDVYEAMAEIDDYHDALKMISSFISMTYNSKKGIL